MSWDNNIYDNPEKFGLTPLGEIEFSEPNYSFDFAVVWVTENGAYYYGQDSGCSCPSPFEDITSVDDLEGPYTRAEIITRLTELEPSPYDPSPSFQSDLVELISRILNT
jgi:hypothetical protein